VGLLHLCLSLTSLLLAFAFAGYVNANVGVPHLNCSNIACRAGGIACTQFVKPPDHYGEFRRGDKYSSPQDSNVATPWTFAADGSFGLDAQVEKLNADIFYNSGERPAAAHCACTPRHACVLDKGPDRVHAHPAPAVHACSLGHGGPERRLHAHAPACRPVQLEQPGRVLRLRAAAEQLLRQGGGIFSCTP
jgi:hypothetical protein